GVTSKRGTGDGDPLRTVDRRAHRVPARGGRRRGRGGYREGSGRDIGLRSAAARGGGEDDCDCDPGAYAHHVRSPFSALSAHQKAMLKVPFVTTFVLLARTFGARNAASNANVPAIFVAVKVVIVRRRGPPPPRPD